MPAPDIAAAPDWFAHLLTSELQAWTSLSQDAIDRLYGHYELLLRWNQKMSLTSVKPGAEMVLRHYCESLFFGAHLPAASPALTVLDLGSGAGFPGIPLAILRPAWRVILVESNQKKAVFLREASRDLSNASVVAGRMEEFQVPGDWVVSRAVDPMAVLGNVPRLAPAVGLMLGEDDLAAVKSLRHIAWTEPIRLPWGNRRVCLYGECFTWNVSGKNHSDR